LARISEKQFALAAAPRPSSSGRWRA
jgi:hypothetical protein